MDSIYTTFLLSRCPRKHVFSNFLNKKIKIKPRTKLFVKKIKSQLLNIADPMSTSVVAESHRSVGGLRPSNATAAGI